jgi:hypothetical protein
MAIVPTHHNMDVKLFESIVVCIPQNFTDEENHLTNDDIITLGRDAACALCKKCKFKVQMNKGSLTTNL